MSIFYRVDNRLVHGQIISTWMPHLRVRHFLIASDNVPNNQLQLTMFRMAIPAEHEFSALPIQEAAQFLNERRASGESILVLLESIRDAVSLFGAGHPFPRLNIGNVHHAPGRQQVTHAVYLGDDENSMLKSLTSRGVNVQLQTLPGDSPVDVKHMLGAH